MQELLKALHQHNYNMVKVGNIPLSHKLVVFGQMNEGTVDVLERKLALYIEAAHFNEWHFSYGLEALRLFIRGADMIEDLTALGFCQLAQAQIAWLADQGVEEVYLRRLSDAMLELLQTLDEVTPGFSPVSKNQVVEASLIQLHRLMSGAGTKTLGDLECRDVRDTVALTLTQAWLTTTHTTCEKDKRHFTPVE